MSNVSMEPVAWGIVASNTGRICQVELDADEVAEHNPKYIVPLYTATQLAAARQQGAEDQTDKTLEAVRVASERIAELEQKNAQLLDALKELLDAHYNGWVTIDVCNKVSAAIKAAEVKP